jgi:hypothetical protein
VLPALVNEADSTSNQLTPSSFGLRDLAAIAALFILVVGLFYPVYYNAAHHIRRRQCESNLGRIGHAAALYAGDHQGSLPFAGFQDGARWLERGVARGPHDSNTKNWRLLVHYQYIDGQMFMCPGADHTAGNTTHIQDSSLAARPTHVSYSFQNMAGPRASIDQIARMPIAADSNPYFQDGAFHGDLPWPYNSSDHGANAGQVVARSDGSSTWQTSPHCGIGGDNIYQAGDRTIYFGSEQPVGGTDSFLIP